MAKKGSRSISCASIQEWLNRQPNEDRPALRQSVNQLKKLYRRQQYGDFVWWYEIGSLVADLCPKGDRHYGENVIALLAQHLEPDQKSDGPRNFLYQARDFPGKFSREKAMELREVRRANGKPLFKNHVTALLCEKDAEKRQRFLDKCLEQSWSVRELRAEIQNAQGRKSSSGGRKPKRPKRQIAGVALPNISLMAGKWLRNHAVWFKGASRPFRTVRKKDCDQAILNDALLAIEKLEEMHEAITDGLEQLNSFVQDLERKLSS